MESKSMFCFKNFEKQIPKNIVQNERPQKLTPCAKRSLKQLLLLGAVILLEAYKVILETLNNNVCNETVGSRLKEAGMKVKTKVKKLFLTSKHRAARLRSM